MARRRVPPTPGQTFGRWTAVAPGPTVDGGFVTWRCRCSCGVERDVKIYGLLDGRSRSCGCLQRDTVTQLNTRHGQAPRKAITPEYTAWTRIVNRCTNTKTPDYPYYGGRGITIADEWRHDPSAFVAHIGPRPSPKHSVDRVDNSLGYAPGNVRWATKREQAQNMRSNRWLTAFGETLVMAEWCRRFHIDDSTVIHRLDVLGWDHERAVSDTEHRRPIHPGSETPR